MVSFICNACGQTVKKNQVEKHFQSGCPNCEVLSCIDCGKDFHGNDYSSHTSCISEAEKYQGKLFKPKDKQNKGEQKQQEWIKHVKEASGADNATSPRIRGLLEKISEYSNVPRKKAKFQNFCRNSLRVRDDVTLDQLWEIFSASVKADQKTAADTDATNRDSKEKEISSEIPERNGAEGSEEKRKSSKKKEQSDSSIKSDKDKDRKEKKRKQKQLDEHGSEKSQKKNKRKRRGDQDEQYEEKTADNSKVSEEANGPDDDGDEAANVVQGMFSWKITIKKVLKGAPDHELPLKKLRKKVMAEFLARGGDNKHRTENELRALFDKKVTKNPLFKVHKERVKLCQ